MRISASIASISDAVVNEISNTAGRRWPNSGSRSIRATPAGSCLTRLLIRIIADANGFSEIHPGGSNNFIPGRHRRARLKLPEYNRNQKLTQRRDLPGITPENLFLACRQRTASATGVRRPATGRIRYFVQRQRQSLYGDDQWYGPPALEVYGFSEPK